MRFSTGYFIDSDTRSRTIGIQASTKPQKLPNTASLHVDNYSRTGTECIIRVSSFGSLLNASLRASNLEKL